MNTLIKNVKMITPFRIIEKCDVLIEDGKIKKIETTEKIDASNVNEVVDGDGMYLSPGFIDIHNHGNYGHDAMEGTDIALESMAKFHTKNGVTGFLAATMTQSKEKTEKAIKNVADYMEAKKNKEQSSSILHGLYLEGPYFSQEKKGSQPGEFIKNPDLKEMKEFLEIGRNNVKIVAIAPELDGARHVIDYLRAKEIVIAVGHTNAKYEEAMCGIEHGITQATHLYNGMRSFTHREPGVIGAVLTDERVSCEMICDGIHCHPAAMKLAVSAKGKNKIILISDAMMATGLEDGEYELGGQKVISKSGAARLIDGTLAGSTLTLDKAVYNMVHLANVPLADAVRMASINPAQTIGIAKTKGSIEIGKDADLLIFDEEINIKYVMINGKVVLNNH
jgi:N-acetylglucosamine-6-phosphate deacetylase